MCVWYLDPLLWVFDHLVAEELGGDEALDPVVHPGPHTNSLPWTRATVKVVPHLAGRHMQGGLEGENWRE